MPILPPQWAMSVAAGFAVEASAAGAAPRATAEGPWSSLEPSAPEPRGALPQMLGRRMVWRCWTLRRCLGLLELPSARQSRHAPCQTQDARAAPLCLPRSRLLLLLPLPLLLSLLRPGLLRVRRVGRVLEPRWLRQRVPKHRRRSLLATSCTTAAAAAVAAGATLVPILAGAGRPVPRGLGTRPRGTTRGPRLQVHGSGSLAPSRAAAARLALTRTTASLRWRWRWRWRWPYSLAVRHLVPGH